MISPDQTEVQGMLEHSLANTRRGLADTRRALRDLRSQRLDDLGLEMALNNMANDAASRGDFNLSINLSGSIPDITPDIEQSMYRIAQETLENIIRHAEAKNVEVILEHDHQHLMLSIIDDGLGFDPNDETLADNLGIKGMKERADLIQGDLKIFSQQGKGTTVRLSIPLLWSLSSNLK